MPDKATTSFPLKGTYLRCRAPGCDAFVLHVRNSRKMPYGDARILGVQANDMLIECGSCRAVTVWWVKKVKSKPELPRPLTLGQRVIQEIEARLSELTQLKQRQRNRVASGLRFEVFMRDDFRCRYCGRSAEDGMVLHTDHVIAESKGGPTTLENLVTACMDCNLGKSDKDLPETARVLR